MNIITELLADLRAEAESAENEATNPPGYATVARDVYAARHEGMAFGLRHAIDKLLKAVETRSTFTLGCRPYVSFEFTEDGELKHVDIDWCDSGDDTYEEEVRTVDGVWLMNRTGTTALSDERFMDMWAVIDRTNLEVSK